jgi:hypothetical protein
LEIIRNKHGPTLPTTITAFEPLTELGEGQIFASGMKNVLGIEATRVTAPATIKREKMAATQGVLEAPNVLPPGHGINKKRSR